MNDALTESTLGEIFEISSSKRVLRKQWRKEGIPFYRAREMVKLARDGKVDNELFISEDLFSELTVRFGSPQPGDLMVSAVGTLGACYVVQPGDRFYFKDASVIRLSPKQPVCPGYFRHAFRTKLILDQINSGSGSTVGTFTISRAKNTRVPLPSLKEQKRIAAILDAADALRAKRRETLAQLDTLLQSTFLEMFGDPVTNPKGWPKARLNDVSDRIIDCPHSTPKWSQSGVICLRTSNLGKGEWNWADTRFVTEADYQKRTKRSEIEPNDIILSREGTIGVMALVSRGMRVCMGQRLVQIRVAPEQIAPKYLLHLLLHDLDPERIGRLMAGSTSKHLNVKELRSLPILVPPLPVQDEFSTIASAIEQQKSRLRAHLDELDTLFGSLQARAFAGEL